MAPLREVVLCTEQVTAASVSQNFRSRHIAFSNALLPGGSVVPSQFQGIIFSATEACTGFNHAALMTQHASPRWAKTFYLGTKLMTPEKARAVWAIYVWCRRTDELVDGPNASRITPEVGPRPPSPHAARTASSCRHFTTQLAAPLQERSRLLAARKSLHCCILTTGNAAGSSLIVPRPSQQGQMRVACVWHRRAPAFRRPAIAHWKRPIVVEELLCFIDCFGKLVRTALPASLTECIAGRDLRGCAPTDSIATSKLRRQYQVT